MKSKNALLRAVFLISCLILLVWLVQRTPEPPAEEAEKLESSETPLWQKRAFTEAPADPRDRKDPGSKVAEEAPAGPDESDITFSEDKLGTLLYEDKNDSHPQAWALCCLAIVLAAGFAIFKVRRSKRQPARQRMRRRELSAAEWESAHGSRGGRARSPRPLPPAGPAVSR
jgi:hypothetical protein